MAKYSDTIDLYDDEGKLLKSGVALEKVSPVVNPAIKKMMDLTRGPSRSTSQALKKA